MVRNPMNIHQVSKIAITPEVIDCIVFWTKNPAPMLERMDELKNYYYYFQFTLNAYGADIEPNVPQKSTYVINTFQRLSDMIGANRVIWRYDPILVNEYYTIDYHTKYFEELAKRLQGYTKKCTISFIDLYRNTTNNVKGLSLKNLNNDDKYTLAKNLSEIALSFGLKVDTCSEDIDLGSLNISHARCIDDRLIEDIIGCKLKTEKDKGQRLECGCVKSIDIGMYNTCLNGCKYCYANYNMNTVSKNSQIHDKNSPLLCGQLTNDDKVTERILKSCRDSQLELDICPHYNTLND